jgi:hypothetical protein
MSSDGLGLLRPTYRSMQQGHTSKTRTHSLFRQGCMLYDLIPNMPEHRLLPLLQAFNTAVANAGVYASALAVTK